MSLPNQSSPEPEETVPSSSAARPARGGMPAHQVDYLYRRYLGPALLLIGSLVALWSLFLPWTRLVPPAGSGAPDSYPPVIPIMSYGQSQDVALLFGAIALLVLCALALLFIPRRARWLPKAVGIVVGIFGFGWSWLMFAFVNFLNDSAYVYTTQVGQHVSFLGYALAILGSVIAGGRPPG